MENADPAVRVRRSERRPVKRRLAERTGTVYELVPCPHYPKLNAECCDRVCCGHDMSKRTGGR